MAAVFCLNLLAPEVLFGLVPGCPLETLTGRECPGCGSTRALSSLARGDLAAAWGFNRLTVSAVVLLPLGMVLRRLRRGGPRTAS